MYFFCNIIILDNKKGVIKHEFSNGDKCLY